MSRYFLRIAAAVLSFFIGFFGVWASGYWKSFENFIVDRFGHQVEDLNRTKHGYIKLIPKTPEEEEQAVYQTIFEELYDHKNFDRLFVWNTTQAWGMSDDDSVIKDCIGETYRGIEQFDQSTCQDYLSKNKTSHKIINLPKVSFSLDLLQEDIQSKNNDDYQKWWIKFYLEHPYARMTNISKIGFNNDYSQAFVYISVPRSSDWTVGEYVRLKKVNGIWQVENIFELYDAC